MTGHRAEDKGQRAVQDDRRADASNVCPGCGYPGGRKACQEIFDDVTLRVRALAWTGSLATWRLMHDVYSVQHEEEYCGRWRGLIAHLGGVCVALEFGASERAYRALQRLVERDHLNGQPYPPPPGIPANRGALTAASLKDLDQPDLLASGVDRWARSVWLAYEPLQPLAREWVRMATAGNLL
jgi:hypothetical protein